MKCPKCHYLSFDPEPRCRNCGYTLTLDPDLAMHPAPVTEAPLADLALRDLDPAPATDGSKPSAPRRPTPPAQGEPGRRTRTTTPGPFDEVADEVAADPGQAEAASEEGLANPFPSEFRSDVTPSPQPPSGARPTGERRARRPAPPPTAELPLFVKGLASSLPAAATRDPDEPVASPSELRVPPEQLFVSPAPAPLRRPHPGRGGSMDPERIGPLDHDLLEGLQRIEHAEQRHAAAQARLDRTGAGVSAGQRLGAASVDALFLGGVGAGIVGVTMRWSGLEWGQVQALPVVPLLAFILLVAIGYLFVFTAASGQTVGKMLMGIRVIDAGPTGADERRVSVSQALYRGALTIPSVLLFGAGFVPALTGDGRAVHDRLAHTRVVRA